MTGAGRTWKTIARGARALAPDAALLLLLGALPALFFWRVLSGAPGDAATFFTGDLSELHFPYRRFVAEELARGRLPLWNPYVSAGHPALGDIQFGSLYPVGAVFALHAGLGMTYLSLEKQIIFHFALAGVFTYLLGRRLFRARTSALVAALTFAYGGYLTSFPVTQMIVLETSVWLPLILLCLDLAICRRSPALAAPAALALAMAALVGHPQTLFYVLLGAGLYFAYRCWDQGWHVAQLAVGAVFLGLGLGLAAPQLVPAYQHLQLTARGDASYPFTTSGFSFRELFGAVVPYRFGGQAFYQGIMPLALAVLGLLHRPSGRARVFWLAVAVVALLGSFGSGTFLQSLFYLGIPPLKFRDHERLAFLLSLAVAILAGYGADALLARHVDRPALRRYVRWLIGALIGLLAIAVLFLYGAVAGLPEVRGTFDNLAARTFFTALLLGLTIALLGARLRPHPLPAWPVLCLLLVGLDLFSTNWQTEIWPGSPADLLTPSPTVTFLRSQPGLYRIASEGLLPGDGNAGSIYRLQDIVGNSPLELEDYQAFDKQVPEVQRWRLLNVRFVITKRDLTKDSRLKLVYREGEVSTYELAPQLRLPRAWIVHRTTLAPSDAAALTIVGGVDPAAEAVVRDARAALEPSAAGQAPPAGLEAAEVVEYTADRIALRATLAQPGLLVVSEVYHPEWVALVDGQPATVYQVDGTLRGLRLPAGAHQIELRYEPRALGLGLAVAGWASLAAGLVIALELAHRRAAWFLPRSPRSPRSLRPPWLARPPSDAV